MHPTPLILAASTGHLALDLLAILSAAAIVSLLARKINLATIPCYLIAGALIGPHALGAAGGGDAGTGEISSLATVMLMFTIGLHLDIGGLRGGLVSIALVTTISAGTFTIVGWPIGMAFGLSAPAALAVAMAMSISSTAVVLRVMEQKRELHLVQGRTALGILILQDMLVPLLMAVVPLIALWAGTGQPQSGPPQSTMQLASKALIAIGGVALLVIVGRLVLPRLLRAAAFSQEVLIVVSAAVALASAVATAALKFSPELGAFLAGFLLASTPFRYQLAGMLAPLRDLFLAIFFTAIGLELSLQTLLEGWWIVLLGVVGVLALKAIIMTVTAWAAGASGAVAVFVGLGLSQGGEFSLVLLAVSRSAGVLDQRQAALAIAIIVLTLIATPNLMDLARRLMPSARRLPPAWWVRKSTLHEATARVSTNPETGEVSAAQSTGGPELGSLTIIAGFGPVGRAVADTLEKRGVIVTIIDLNPRTVEKQHSMGRSIVYGDASNLDVLHKAGLEQAQAIVLTMPDEEAVLRACRIIRQTKPDIFIAARLNVLSKALQAMQEGADHTIVEELATAEAMAKQVIIKLEQRAAGEDAGPKLYQVRQR